MKSEGMLELRRLADTSGKEGAEDGFNLQTLFDITVPGNYNHKTQISTLNTERNSDNFCVIHSGVTDNNFDKVTEKLVPGKTYSVKIFKMRYVEPEDCLLFLAKQKAMLVGPQGLSLVWQLKKEKFPTDKDIFSLDKKDALWRDAINCLQMPFVNWEANSVWYFGLEYFKAKWFNGHYLLCVYDLAEK